MPTTAGLRVIEPGIAIVEDHLGIDNLYEAQNAEVLHHVYQALKAHTLFKRDGNYLIEDGKVIIKTRKDGNEIEEEFHVIHVGEKGEKNITIDVMKEGGEPHVIKMIHKGDHDHGDKVVLHCPEGDTTMVIDKENAEEIYLCPKHNVELEPVAHKVIKKKVEVKTKNHD